MDSSIHTHILTPSCIHSLPHFLSHGSELLVQALFRPDITVNPDHKDKYIYLLAYAASVHEETGVDGRVPIKEELSLTQEAIESAHGICSSANDSHTELLTNMATLFATLRSVTGCRVFCCIV